MLLECMPCRTLLLALHSRSQSGLTFALFQVGGKVGYLETGLLLDIAPHRPDLDGVIADGIREASALGADEIGLYVGGKCCSGPKPGRGTSDPCAINPLEVRPQ